MNLTTAAGGGTPHEGAAAGPKMTGASAHSSSMGLSGSTGVAASSPGASTSARAAASTWAYGEPRVASALPMLRSRWALSPSIASATSCGCRLTNSSSAGR